MYNENFESDRGKAMGFDFKKGFKGSGPFLAAGGTIELDEERKAQMASNLMVVLCGESEAHPVLNAGSLY